MKTEFRVILTGTFDTAAERDKVYDSIKNFMISTASKSAVFKRADITKDEYPVPENITVSEKVI